MKGEGVVRYAVDPVAGREVDKAAADAYILEGIEGEALYFELPWTVKEYRASMDDEGKR